MPKEKRGLGKGLEALISGSSLEPTISGLTMVSVDDIAPNPLQPRARMDPAALEELAESIRAHGLIQPLIVTRAAAASEDVAGVTPAYQLIAGERRLQAARLAGLHELPVIVKEATPQQMLELALVENIQRADLNPLEEAAAYRHLIEDFGLTQEQVAEKVGRNRVSVTNTLRLLRLPEAIRAALSEQRISEGHARAMLGLEREEDQRRLLRLIETRGLSVRQTEETVRRWTTEPKTPRVTLSPDSAALEKSLREALGTKVNLTRSRRGGKVVIYFFSEEELETIYERIVGRATPDVS